LDLIHAKTDPMLDEESDCDTHLFSERRLGSAASTYQTIENRIDAAVTLDAAESEQRYRSLFETMLQGVVYQDAAGRITAINPAAERMLGVSAVNVIGKTRNDLPWELVHEDGTPYSVDEYPGVCALQGKLPIVGHVVRVRPNPQSDIRWLSIDCIPQYRVGEETPYQLYSIFVDITEEKKAAQAQRNAERELRERKRNLRLALESGGLGSYKIDFSTWTLVEASDICKAHFGRLPEESFTLSDLVDSIMNDDKDGEAKCVDWVISAQRDYMVEFRIAWRDGSIHWLAAHGAVTEGDQGLPTCLVGVIQDITSRKKTEQEQHAALKEARDRAERDPLTGLLNHRALHKRLQDEAARCRRENRMLAVAMLDLDNFKFFNDVYGHASGDNVLRQVAERLEECCHPNDIIGRFGGDEFCIVVSDIDDVSVKSIEERIQSVVAGLEYRPDGTEFSIPITISVGVAVLPRGSVEWQDVVHRADDRLRLLKSGGGSEEEPESIKTAAANTVEGFSMLDALVAAVDNKDRYTRRHSEDVLTYSTMIAAELGLDSETQQIVAVAALLHDVGKIGVPDAVLRKPGRLTESEYAAVKQHPEMGAVIVSAVEGLECVLDAVRHHHERWDGQGYPHGLGGEDIPQLARLMAVADAFSAMTTDRPYRRGMSMERARCILMEGAGHQWDAQCVEAFLRALDKRDAVDIPANSNPYQVE